MTCRSDGIVRGIEVSTGKEVLRLRGPEIDESIEFLQDALNVIPASEEIPKTRLVVEGGGKYYCVEGAW